MPVCLDMLRPAPGGWGGGLFRGLALMGLIRGLGCEIGFGPCGVLWLPVCWLRPGFENRGIPPFSDWSMLPPLVVEVVSAD